MLLRRLAQADTEAAFSDIVETEAIEWPIPSLGPVPIEPESASAIARLGPVTFADRDEYCLELRRARLDELSSAAKMEAIRLGLSSIIPLDILAVLTWQDVELRVCGQPQIDLALLRAHTIYN